MNNREMTEAEEDAWFEKRAAALAYRARPGSWTSYHGVEGATSYVPCTCLTEGKCLAHGNPAAKRRQQDKTNARRKAARAEKGSLHYIN